MHLSLSTKTADSAHKTNQRKIKHTVITTGSEICKSKTINIAKKKKI